MKPEISTLNYYNMFAADFIAGTQNTDVSEAINGFIEQLPQRGRVLDVGCGSGRDTLTFLSKGFDVTAFDASSELARIASEKISHPVEVLRIEDMTWSEEFDGVWAMASLLHVPKKDMHQSIQNCVDALKPKGKFFLAIKEGTGESYDERGRFFSYYKAEELNHVFQNIKGMANIKISSSSDTLGRGVNWLHVTVEKSPKLKLVM